MLEVLGVFLVWLLGNFWVWLKTMMSIYALIALFVVLSVPNAIRIPPAPEPEPQPAPEVKPDKPLHPVVSWTVIGACVGAFVALAMAAVG